MNAGKYIAVITLTERGKENYSVDSEDKVTIRVPFEVKPAMVTSVTLPEGARPAYTGAGQSANLVVKATGGVPFGGTDAADLTLNGAGDSPDYQVKEYKANTDAAANSALDEAGLPLNAGNYTAIIEALSPNYTVAGEGAVSEVTYDITKAAMAAAKVTVDDSALVYDGHDYAAGDAAAVKAAVKVTMGDRTLQLGSDYDVIVMGKMINAGGYQVYVLGAGNYDGRPLGLIRCQVHKAPVTATMTLDGDVEGLEFGDPIPGVTVKFDGLTADDAAKMDYGHGTAATNPVRFRIATETPMTTGAAGHYSYDVYLDATAKNYDVKTPDGNTAHSGDKLASLTFDVAPKPLSSETIVKDMSAGYPNFLFDTVRTDADGKAGVYLRHTTEFNIAYYNRLDTGAAGSQAGNGRDFPQIEGKYIARFTGIRNYTGTVDVPFDIGGTSLANGNVIQCTTPATFTHNAAEQKVVLNVTDQYGTDMGLVAKRDYSAVYYAPGASLPVPASYENGRYYVPAFDAGEYRVQVVASPNGGYNGSLSASFTMAQAVLNSGVAQLTVADVNYDPNVTTVADPKVTMRSSRVTLTRGQDYDVKYYVGSYWLPEAGEHTALFDTVADAVTASGQNPMDGPVTVNALFTAAGFDWDTCTDLAGSNFTTMVTEVEDSPAVPDDPETGDVDESQPAVTHNEYGQRVAFRVLPPTDAVGAFQTLSRANLNTFGAAGNGIATYAYTGKPICPGVSLSANGTALVEGVDYVLGYTNNVRPGIAVISITGIGKYNGTFTDVFRIVIPDQVDDDVTILDVPARNQGATAQPAVTFTARADGTVASAATFTIAPAAWEVDASYAPAAYGAAPSDEDLAAADSATAPANGIAGRVAQATQARAAAAAAAQGESTVCGKATAAAAAAVDAAGTDDRSVVAVILEAKEVLGTRE